jgi:hypothetical protein
MMLPILAEVDIAIRCPAAISNHETSLTESRGRRDEIWKISRLDKSPRSRDQVPCPSLLLSFDTWSTKPILSNKEEEGVWGGGFQAIAPHFSPTSTNHGRGARNKQQVPITRLHLLLSTTHSLAKGIHIPNLAPSRRPPRARLNCILH